MLNTDSANHARLRDPAKRALATRFRARRDHLRYLGREVLAALENREEFDLLAEVARPLAVAVIADLLGVPADDIGQFATLAVRASPTLDPMSQGAALDSGLAGAAALRAYFEALPDRGPPLPADAMVTALWRDHVSGLLTADEVLATLNLMVIGGYEPLADFIANGILTLLRYPDQLDRLRQDPALLPLAVEELLRYDSTIQVAARVAPVDVVLHGAVFRQGEPAILLLGSANRDPAAFREPDALDIGRHPNGHVAFGAGAHSCLGAPVVRLIGRLVFELVFERFPKLECVGPPRWRSSLAPKGLVALPVLVG